MYTSRSVGICILSFVMFLVVFSPSCGLFMDDGVGTGLMNVVVNDEYFQLTEVTGTEYMGFFCGGNLRGKRLSLSLGQNPVAGDTLSLTTGSGGLYPVYGMYGHKYGKPGSGAIIITRKSGSVLTGTFSFDVIDQGDTLRFRLGYFQVNCEPSR